MSADHKRATNFAEVRQHYRDDDTVTNLSRAYLEARAALKYCYEKLQPLQPFEDWVKEIGHGK